jgi:hypothetical protein
MLITPGRPPTLLRVWAQTDRVTVTVTVTDTGPGPTDPLVGLLPPDPLTGPGPGPRVGLWLSHQLVDVAHRHHPDGYPPSASPQSTRRPP